MVVCRQARYIITILFQLVYHGQAKYRISQNATSWNTATDMAIPEIQYGSKPGEYLINNTNLLLTPEMSSVWIGYYQVPVGFEYIGCIKKDDIENLDVIIQQPINGDPGECFLGCSDASIIAVSDQVCYCLNENYHSISETKRSECTRICSSVLSVACGGTMATRDYLSVYRMISNVTKQETKSSEQLSVHQKMCLTFNPPQANFIWDDCGLYISWMCFYGNRIMMVPHTDYKTWIDTSSSCFSETTMPVPYLKHLNWGSIGSKSVFWTGIFKTNATLKSHDVPDWVDFTTADIKYGMLEYNTTEKKHYLQFVKKDTQTRKSLCKTEAGDTTTPSDSTAKNTNNVPDGPDDKNNKNKIPTESTISDTSSTQSETSQKQPESNNTMVIGVVVGVCSFVVILIIIIIILLKRRGSRCCLCVTKKPSQTDDEKTTSGIVPSANENHAYLALEPHELEQAGNACSVDYNYVDVEMSSNPRTGNKAADKATTAKPLSKSNTDDDTYDTTTGVNKGKESDGENIYNKLSSNDNTYSTTTHAVKQNCTNQNTEELYNELGGDNKDTYDSTTIRRQDIPDDIYDKTSPVQDDTYSHLQNHNKLQNVHTDNVYGSAT